MTTVVNTPGGNSDGSGVGMIVGVIVMILVIILFVIYVLPAIRDNNPEPVNQGSINVTLPPVGGDNGGDSGGGGNGTGTGN